ncbi:uncharacterized protein LOC131930122 [Physella acuta]|uniref:uncharacterized protein LOC131930122 n=1 Tax=Physella acuta TaxID=109671 RepID=UPI0027DDD5BA|nr:uncharacterized protein LOC131930122 [Physella acuta]
MLLKAPSLEPELEAKRLLTAKALICGGAVFEIREQYNSSLTRRLGVHTYAPNFNNLIQLFRDVCPVIPRPCLERWHQHIRQIGMMENTAALQKELEAFNSRVPSLLQISKLCLRQCLGGHVWCYTKCLPLPDKIKDYICSV